MAENPLDGPVLGRDTGVVPVVVELAPLVVELPDGRHGLIRDGQKLPVRVFLDKAGDVVALFLEFFARKLRQVPGVIEVVVIGPVGRKAVPAGEIPLHPLLCLGRDRKDHQPLAVLFGVLPDGLQHTGAGLAAGARREQIVVGMPPLAAGNDPVLKPGNFSMVDVGPHKDGNKRIFAACITALPQQRPGPLAVLGRYLMKIHPDPSKTILSISRPISSAGRMPCPAAHSMVRQPNRAAQ